MRFSPVRTEGFSHPVVHEPAQGGIIVTMAGTDDIWQALEEADALPHGHARIERLEELVALADIDNDPERGSAARLSLVPAYLYGGRHREIAPVLTWLLQRYDEEPAWFGPWERQGVLFSFTWATSALLPHPDVPLAQIEAALADMSARYKVARESMTPVLKVRFDLAAHRHGHAEADEPYEAWIAARKADLETGNRSVLADCQWCEQADQVAHLAATGRHEEAVAIALPALDGPVECRAQPFAMVAASLESLLLTGHEERAALEHLRGVRLLRMHADDDAGDPAAARRPDQAHEPATAMPGRAEHLLLLGRSGRLERGLELLELWMPWLGSKDVPAHLVMVTAAAGARLLKAVVEAGGGDIALTTGRWGEVSAERLSTRLAGRARELAARFDARNGTDAATLLVEELLVKPPLPVLPLDPISRSTEFARIPVRPPAPARRGRRVARADGPQALADAGDLVGLAQAFEDAAQADSGERKETVLAAWRSTRLIYADLEDDDVEGSRCAARLDGWLAVADLEGGADAEARRTAAAEAADRLRRAGLSVEALLHEQASVLAAAGAGRIDAAEAMTRIGKTAAQVAAEGTPGQIGLAYCRLALAREAGVRAGVPDPPPAPEPAEVAAQPKPENDPVDQSIAALTSVPADELNHLQRRALARMLRLRAVDEQPDLAVESLREAIAVLPDGVRPLERAMVHADLAARLAGTDSAGSVQAWSDAVDDALTADAAPVLGNLLAASATVRHGMGDPLTAADELTRAIPLLDEHSPGPLAAQARFDLARVLLDCGRSIEAAELAEAALADLTARINQLELLAPLDYSDRDPQMAELIHLAGSASFVAAEATAILGDVDGGRALAARSAAWHRRNGNLVAQSEAWQLAARIGGDPAQVVADLQRATDLAEEAGDWDSAATCRREKVAAIQEAHGVAAALDALTEADEALQEVRDGHGGERANERARRRNRVEPSLQDGQRLSWHRVALAERRARLLALLGRFEEALVQIDGLEESYRMFGDDRSARDLRGLRGQLRAELGEFDAARLDLELAAEEAERAGDATQTQGLGQRLAAVLDEAGRPGDAEDAWARFCAEAASPADVEPEPDPESEPADPEPDPEPADPEPADPEPAATAPNAPEPAEDQLSDQPA